MSFIRTLTYSARIFCILRQDTPYPVPEKYCTDNAYESVWKDFEAREEADDFEISLNIWRDNILESELDILTEEGDNKCQDLSESLHICSYQIKDIEVVEEEIILVPEFVLKTISDLEKRKVEAKTIERKDKIQKTIDELKQEYGIKIE